MMALSGAIEHAQQVLQDRQPLYATPGKGQRFVNELRSRHPLRMVSLLRVTQEQFERLLAMLVEDGLTDRRSASAAEHLAIFLFICAQDASYRLTSEIFGHGTATISDCFHHTLDVLRSLYKKVVSLPPDETPLEIRDNSKLWPYFMDCLGAVDGTLIPISVKFLRTSDEYVPWRCRKGFLAQNVMAAVGFDMNFQFVLAGWEGSAHDGRVFRSAQEKGFRLPDGRYYLADAGYASEVLLTPYQKIRYHLRDWDKVGLKPQTAQELFNLRHSSARNVVERTFGVLKTRFKILTRGRDGFNIPTQVRIVYALVAIHNFMNLYGSDPEKEADEMTMNEGTESNGQLIGQTVDEELRADSVISGKRSQITSMMWEDFEKYVSRNKK